MCAELQALRLRGRDDGVEPRYVEVTRVESRDAIRLELVVCTKGLRGGDVVEAAGW